MAQRGRSDVLSAHMNGLFKPVVGITPKFAWTLSHVAGVCPYVHNLAARSCFAANTEGARRGLFFYADG